MSPVPCVTEDTFSLMHKGSGVDRLHPDMHAFTTFPEVKIPHVEHLCNWSQDDTASLAVGPKTVAKVAETLHDIAGDRRVVDAGWDTMG